MMLCCCTYAYQSIHDVNQLDLGQLLSAFPYDHRLADWTGDGYAVYMGSVQCFALLLVLPYAALRSELAPALLPDAVSSPVPSHIMSNCHYNLCRDEGHS